MKRVYLLRHAKSGWDNDVQDDHARSLSPRGERAAQIMATEMQSRSYIPASIKCSSARRTQETLGYLATTWQREIPTAIDSELYLAPADLLLDKVRETRDDYASVLILAHNPGLEELVDLLTDRTATKRGALSVPGKFPTAALAVFDFYTDEWREVLPGKGDLVDLIFPKELVGE